MNLYFFNLKTFFKLTYLNDQSKHEKLSEKKMC